MKKSIKRIGTEYSGFVWVFVNDYDIAQDLAQETFIIIWQKLETFRNESSIGTWIFRIASNNCLRQLEKEKRFPKSDLPIHLTEEKQQSLEPQISVFVQMYFQVARNGTYYYFIRIRRGKASRNCQNRWAF